MWWHWPRAADGQLRRRVHGAKLKWVTTALLIADELGYKRKDIVVDERIYASSPDDFLAIICPLDNGLDRVMFVDHNPEFTDLAYRLSRTIVDVPTCAVAAFRFDAKASADVAEIAIGEGEDGSSEEIVRTSSLRLPGARQASTANTHCANWPSSQPIASNCRCVN